MTYCNSCGKEQIQDYTFDENFTCNACLHSSASSIDDSTNNGNQDPTVIENNSFNNNMCLSTLISQIDFLKSQITEKDHFIRQLLLLINTNSHNNYSGNPMKESTPVVNSLFDTPSQISIFDSYNSENSIQDDSTIIDAEISSFDNNQTYIIKDEVDCSTMLDKTKPGNINKQLINIQSKQHANLFTRKNSIYSDISDSSFKSSPDSDACFINKVTLEKREKIKLAINKIKKLEKEPHARFRVKNHSFPWPKNTTLVIGDSILQGLNENRLKRYNVKIRSFPGSTIDDLYDYIKPLLKKNPTNVVIHCGTNDAARKTAGEIINELKNLQVYIEEKVPGVDVFFSTPIIRLDDVSLNKKLRDVSSYLEQNFKLVMSSFNIDRTCLGKKGLHLNPKGSGRLATNLITLMKRL